MNWLLVVDAVWILCTLWVLYNVFKLNDHTHGEKVAWTIAGILLAPFAAGYYYYKYKR